GELFAYQRSGVKPDIMGLAKALGGGFPVGACLATSEAAKGMTTGTHGSTFGGNPLAMAAGNAVLDVMLADGFFDHVRRMSLVLKQKLAAVKDRYPGVISEVRGEGLLLGLRAVVPSAELVDELRAERMITVAAGDNVVRLLPPLIVSEAEVAEGGGGHRRGGGRQPRGRGGGGPGGGGREGGKGRPPLPRPDRHPAAGAARDARGEPRHEGAARARAGVQAAGRAHAGDDLRQ